MGRSFFLTLHRAPGDTLALTALLRDIKKVYPDWHLGVCATQAHEILAHNPNVTTMLGTEPGIEKVKVDYRPGVAAAKKGVQLNFLREFHTDFFRHTGVQIPLTEPKPDLYLTELEKQTRPFPFRYWVVIAGHKSDIPTKGWSGVRYQQVVTETRKLGFNWVQAGGKDEKFKHIHHGLQGATDLVAKTTLRQLFTLIYHAEGVLCGITMGMLIASAFDKPCVVVAGGRESYSWVAFDRENPTWDGLGEKIVVPHRFLHTIGKLDCCAKAGCWASQIVAPHNDSPFPQGFICSKPDREGEQPIPTCMKMVTTDMVIRALLSYYQDGTLPPLAS